MDLFRTFQNTDHNNLGDASLHNAPSARGYWSHVLNCALCSSIPRLQIRDQQFGTRVSAPLPELLAFVAWHRHLLEECRLKDPKSEYHHFASHSVTQAIMTWSMNATWLRRQRRKYPRLTFWSNVGFHCAPSARHCYEAYFPISVGFCSAYNTTDIRTMINLWSIAINEQKPASLTYTKPLLVAMPKLGYCRTSSACNFSVEFSWFDTL